MVATVDPTVCIGTGVTIGAGALTTATEAAVTMEKGPKHHLQLYHKTVSLHCLWYARHPTAPCDGAPSVSNNVFAGVPEGIGVGVASTDYVPPAPPIPSVLCSISFGTGFVWDGGSSTGPILELTMGGVSKKPDAVEIPVLVALPLLWLYPVVVGGYESTTFVVVVVVV